MENILILVLSACSIVNAAIAFYWMRKCDKYKSLLNKAITMHSSLFVQALEGIAENLELKAKLKDLEG